MKNVIEIENLSKVYDLGLVGTGTLSKDLNRAWAKLKGLPDPYSIITETNDRTKESKSNSVFALRDINFNVQQGEVLGIVGSNGAGKSTLLKILSQITSPSTGSIKMVGRVASLLEVGTGMHPEMTARQNIFLNGSIMGMHRHEIKSKLDEIISFAGIEKYIDTPVKRFSSGMSVRLGFAVAAFLEPEILIVDEVLAVGDAEFQRKAIGKMQDISKGHGRTVLFVSHNMSAVKSLCTKAIILKNGELTFSGNATKCVEDYLVSNQKIKQAVKFDDKINEKNVRLIKIKISPKEGQKLITVETGFNIEVEFENYNINKTIACGINVSNQELVQLFELPCFLTEKNSKKGTFYINANIPPFLLNAGIYNISFVLAESQKYILMNKQNILAVEIEDTSFNKGSNLNKPLGILRPKIFPNVKFKEKISE
jgi:lipopolysaccharide transport system ATP-binding protein